MAILTTSNDFYKIMTNDDKGKINIDDIQVLDFDICKDRNC